ncbi:MAG TPA: hypothetical protein VNQ50_04280 [Xanthobacteraceae bacterium]|jgi:hypothetical protein|nr:hypothetical protein [Xanthobacteraceae bacterium]
MSVIKPDRTAETEQATAAAATAAVEQVEGEIRAFVRRDVSAFRRARQDSGDTTPEGISSLIERASGASVAEIERVIAELVSVRDMLRNEGERVQREIAGYANLSQAAMTSMKIIADSMSHWKSQSAQAVNGLHNSLTNKE